ncbi:MAG TPA: hypothetical protein VD866_12110 [Urbifossiella sp.]|nr:hypothetical protein [Urbifossiella sp.]
MSDNPNCLGCGSPLAKPVCAYCRRRCTPEQAAKIKPDPKDDPRRTAFPRKVYC